MTEFCALCQAPLTKDNNSNEHIFPNAIGGRKTVRNFICETCNNDTGRRWDIELCEQLRPFCTMLNIKRDKGINQPVSMKDTDDKEFVLNPDASISIPHFIRTEHAVGDKIEVVIQANSRKVAKRQLVKESAKRPSLNVEEVLSNATSLRDQVKAPLRMSLPLFLSGEGTGRSIVKSCLGLAQQAGVSADDCPYGKLYLEGKRDACFGHYSASNIVTHRPAKIFFHCVCVRGDPTQGLILAYVEYFGCYKIVVRLSDSYSGDAFNICYAIDPVSGKELDLEVELEFTQDEIPAILSNEQLDEIKSEDCLKILLAECYRSLMITAAIENANAQLGIKSKQPLTEEQFSTWSSLVADSLARALLGIPPAHDLGARDWGSSDDS